MKKKKQKLALMIQPPYAPLWRFECSDGVVAVYSPNGEPLTVERANFLMDFAKMKLLADGLRN